MDTATRRKKFWQFALVVGILFQGIVAAGLYRTAPPQNANAPAAPDVPSLDFGRPGDLPAPSGVGTAAFEAKLFAFLNARKYVDLGWKRDKVVRDTGPFIGGKSYGTHPAVRVYYSPGVIRWLIAGRVGKIPDGEMIIKEQYTAPAIRHAAKTEAELWAGLESWTVMVKDSAGSHDGWFWSNPVKGQCVVDEHRYPHPYPVSGFGQYCVRCHASTKTPGEAAASKANEFTFTSLRNVAGFPGEPILFRVDDSWRKAGPAEGQDAHPTCARPAAPKSTTRRADAGMSRLFPSLGRLDPAKSVHLPPVTHDWFVNGADRSQEFATSNQCMNCHAGLVAPFGPSMFVPAGASTEYGAAGRDVSPYGEWRWTPMGLAGRDPFFHAQLENEVHSLRDEFPTNTALVKELGQTLTETCLRCHAAMGKKQFEIDHAGGKEKFSLAHVHAATGHADAKYGALARDGVSCMVCHRMQPRIQPPEDHRPYLQFFLETSITGNLHFGRKGEIFGPFPDDELSPYAMEHATGLKPKHDGYLKSSRLCGSCHAVALPNIDRPLGEPGSAHGPDELTRSEVVPLYKKFHHHLEQATYLEWLNSEYENEVDSNNPNAKTCQDCHMARGVTDERHAIQVPTVRSRIAAIQDTGYPEGENLAPHDALNVRVRQEGYRRHNFSGLNVFLLEMFSQFDDVLGVAKEDFMTGSKSGLGDAIADMVRTAGRDTASMAVRAERDGKGRLTATVRVDNKAGHRFPTGVGFRRAFLELAVIEQGVGKPDRTLWVSGRTNAWGELLDGDGRVLPTETFAPDPATGEQRFQPHHEVITSPDQAQVYETLLRNAKGRFTTSFVRGCETVKDNRLLPRGWKPAGPGPALTGRYLAATHPDRATARDPRYSDGSGSDEVIYRIDLPRDADPTRVQVRATLYYQATPPYFLRNLFESGSDGPATRRLHSLCSHVDLKGTPIEGWKLRIASTACEVERR